MRKSLSQAYTENMTEFLVRTRNMDREQAREMVRTTAKSKVQDKQVRIQHCERYGDSEVKNTSLYKLLDDNRGRIITPGGSIYLQQKERQGILGQLSSDQLAERKRCKKNMFKAKAEGDAVSTDIWNQMQTIIKIMMNSLPGGFGSPHNLFYDKGGYNAITSLARALIAVSYTTAEQLLSGLFAWYTEDDVVTHIINTLKDTPTHDEVFGVLTDFNLKQPSGDDLYNYFYSIVSTYQPYDFEMTKVRSMISTMSEHEVVFLYYFFNLKNIMRDNEEVAKQWLADCIQTENIEPADEVDTDLDEMIMELVTPMVNEQLQGQTPDDFLTEGNELGKWYTAVAHNVEANLKRWQPVFDTFVLRAMGMPDLNSTKNMVRESVIISDTDSVIFTLNQWVTWYTNSNEVNSESYSVAALLIYWLTKVTSHELYKFGERQGADEHNLHIMQMKNEFMYPALLLFDAKKTYAGITTIQEGVVLPEPKEDVKGGPLRGSNMGSRALKFIRDFITKSVLQPSLNDRLSAQALIAEVCAWEDTMRQSILAGNMEFYKVESIKFRNEYKDATATQYFSYLAWHEIFAPKYGEVEIPTKGPIMQVLPTDNDYIEWLKEHYPETAQRWYDFYKKYGKEPKYFIVNEDLDEPPPELMKIVDVRSMIYHNITPVYMVLNKLGIGVGFRDKCLLLSDLYT